MNAFIKMAIEYLKETADDANGEHKIKHAYPHRIARHTSLCYDSLKKARMFKAITAILLLASRCCGDREREKM